MPVNKPKRIVMHWTAGKGEANSSDLDKYHEVVEADGTRVLCSRRPEANNDTSDGDYAAHTRRFNTGAIGLAMCGMQGAQESPFRKGRYAISEPQLEAFISMVAEYVDTYDIPLDRRHVLSHKEVHHTHGIYQDKWDIMWLPHMASPGHAVDVGDHLRDRIRQRHREIYGDTSIMASLDRENLVEDIVGRIRDELNSRRL
ncbi:MAG: N-acetylmuramoyl-L-alanine amidase [Pseudomonadota bacterium]